MEASINYPEGEASDAGIPSPEEAAGHTGLTPEVLRDALETEIESLREEDEDGNTHIIRRYGEDIGAATAYTTTVSTGSGREVHGVDLEAIDTSPENYRSAYLAFVMHLIASDPFLASINGEGDDKMTVTVPEIEPHLPRGWYCEYRLYTEYRRTSVTTPNPQDMLDHLESGGIVDFAFKRLHLV